MQTLKLPATGPLLPKRLGNLEKPPASFGNFEGLSVSQNRLYERAWNDRICWVSIGRRSKGSAANLSTPEFKSLKLIWMLKGCRFVGLQVER